MKACVFIFAVVFQNYVYSQGIGTACPNGYVESGDKCFKAYSLEKSWPDAMNACHLDNATLAKIENEDDANTVMSLTQGIQNSDPLTLSTGNDYHYHYTADQGFDFDVTNTTSITIEVMACNDAHIALSQIKGQDKNLTYEIVIGGWADSQSVIRTFKQGPHMDTSAHQNHPVNCIKFLPFWISWANHVISVGKGNVVGQNTFLHWKDPHPHPVNNVAFATGWGSTGKWKFYSTSSVPAKFWVGGTNKASTNQWQWAPEMTNFGYTNWATSQPNMANIKHCLLVDAGQNDKWLNEDCTTTNYYICQSDAQNLIIG